jgi:hypothetical protein
MLTIKLERKAKGGHGGGTPALYLVRDSAGDIVGLVEKFKNTRTDKHPWKAYLGFGMDAKFLGAFYDGGCSAAVNAIADKIAANRTAVAKA